MIAKAVADAVKNGGPILLDFDTSSEFDEFGFVILGF
jgi:hypothetical protein